jgi:hypothetical protein
VTWVAALFLLLVFYQLKHFLADYILQGEYMLGKFKPGWAFFYPLLAHVGVHAGMTFAVAAFAIPLLNHYLYRHLVVEYALGIAAFDAIVHFFMDRIKASPRYMGRWKPLTADEYVHNKKLLSGPAFDPKCTEDQPEDVKFWLEQVPKNRVKARARLRGNKLFWWALGFDQMVHHLTHYGCIYFILHVAGAL